MSSRPPQKNICECGIGKLKSFANKTNQQKTEELKGSSWVWWVGG